MTARYLTWLEVASVIMVVQACTIAQTPPKTKAPPTNQERVTVKRNVQTFLNSWLVNRDLEAAKQAFGAAAYQNEAMLQETCAGYIKPEQKFSEEARRAGIVKFLQDFLPPVQRLSQVLNESAAVQLGAGLANDPKADGFVLAKLSRDHIPTSLSEVNDYLKSRLPAEFYAAFVSIGSGTVYFLWVREGSTWRILHASLVCM